MPLPTPSYRYVTEPPPAMSRNRRRLILLAVAALVAGLLLPWTYRRQLDRVPPVEDRAWSMRELINITQTDAVQRFGRPYSARDYNLQKGSFVGPRTGLKHYYALDSLGYEARFQARGAVAWVFPQFSAVREVVWHLPDSTLTIWFHQPRAEIDFSKNEEGEMRMPLTPPGEWVALDNYRVGKNVPTADLSASEKR